MSDWPAIATSGSTVDHQNVATCDTQDGEQDVGKGCCEPCPSRATQLTNADADYSQKAGCETEILRLAQPFGQKVQARIAAMSGWLFATIVARPGDTNSAAWDIPR
nr:hypothetical protein [Nordella sp. HKS 07]